MYSHSKTRFDRQAGMTDRESDISTNKHIFDIACCSLCLDAAVCRH